LAVEVLLDGEAEAITRKAIELAKMGDLTAIRLCLDGLHPQEKIVLSALRCPLWAGLKTQPRALQQSSQPLSAAS
jgi:hypothetical protein